MNDISTKIAGLSPEKRAQLEQQLLNHLRPQARSTIPPRQDDGPAQLSFAQERLWFLDQLEPGVTVYNEQAVYRLIGKLNVDILRRSLEVLVNRHPILRTVYRVVDGAPVQMVDASVTISLQEIDLRALPEERLHEAIGEQANRDANDPINLRHGPVARVTLLHVNEKETIFIRTVHHIAHDGWSSGIFLRELSAIYNAMLLGQSPALVAPPIDYADFAVWQRGWLQGPDGERQLAYWRAQLQGVQVLELPTDRPRPAEQTHLGAHHLFSISPTLFQSLRQLGREENATPFMVLLAAFQTLLHRYSGQDDIAVGSPFANRTLRDLEGLIGLFVNTLVLRNDFSGEPTFRELLQRVRTICLGAYEHQDMPFERLVAALQPVRSLSHSPLFQVFFALQNMPIPPLQLTDVRAERIRLDTGRAKFDLSLYLYERDDGLQALFEYSTDLFDATTIERMTGHFCTLLAAIAAEPDVPIARLPLLTSSERHQILVEWNDSTRAYPTDKSIHYLFAEQAKRTPHAVAVFAPAPERPRLLWRRVWKSQSLTYRELNQQANRLAHHLLARGVGPESPVGICLRRSPQMVVCILAVLKSGGAYVPLDPTYPEKRLSLMMERSTPVVVLTESHLAEHLPPDTPMICVDELDLTVGDQTEPAIDIAPNHLAYILFTSGSTGEPKGVMGTHRGVVNGCAWLWQTYPFRSGERCCAKTSLNFVDSVRELFAPLLQGVPLLLIPEATVGDPPALVELLSQERITRLTLVPSLLQAVLEICRHRGITLADLWHWTASGELLRTDLATQFYAQFPHARLLNLYGSTEVAADATGYEVPRHVQGDRVSIGRPLANVRCYVLDRYLCPVPVGIPGDLYIAGDGLSRGYYQRPEWTAERFIRTSLDKDRRLYHTGDRACWREDGNLEYLGRTDQQVKVQGIRIELGDIEANLSQHPDVHACAVVARPDQKEPCLVAFVKTNAHAQLNSTGLRGYLAQRIPSYMVPATVVQVEALPHLPNGKIDRQNLPLEPMPLEGDFVAPRNDLEAQLVRIWESVLAKRPIGVTDEFFDLGGHSLLAAHLFMRIEQSLGKRLPLATLFQHPTIAQQAELLRHNGWEPYWSPLVAVQPNGTKPPLYCMAPAGGNVVSYRDLAVRLGDDRPVYALQSQGLDGIEVPWRQVDEMAVQFMAAIRAFQPEGPYHLCGASFGGMVAFEIACQLHQQGVPVGFVGLFDTYGPGYPQWPPGTSRTRRRLNRLWRRVESHASNVMAADRHAKKQYVRTKGRQLAQRLFWEARQRLTGIPTPMPAHFTQIKHTNLAAGRVYRPQVYPGRLILFRASHQPRGILPDPTLGWDKWVSGELEILEVPGHHGHLTQEPRAQVLAEKVAAYLATAD